ncbi:exodeoxyribonuclease VII large subunit [Dysgonomonas sp. PH5-45]|uniref:exodeoxyribonuclease VII large subunit n=1 Tax=unclassified Dysgonomonas TaxID=2630389 RepID=UPI00247631EA|nr:MULTISPECIES: exodeoxyribonuclease VII large subunit [unclassified Dysgonomonas]MDH6355528.1 exodeoxyribonuclease VII large subunit [Dysgonomonas sp. PH5-45]MDH6388411.1 exodeoxyribonuclease VII large subunit [Dysgonomonas sp. PH5-37]
MDNIPSISLHELNSLIRTVVDESLPRYLWVRAETSDVRVNQNGHCYLEFIEKDASGKNVVAKARGAIWSNIFRMLKPFFEQETGQAFTSGLNVLVQVSVDFHELYGFSLTVQNIDPSYTLGDQARNRARIIKQLEDEGVLDMNKELKLPQPTNRIAVISSPTAAGYEDFCNQLQNNQRGFVFYTKLFPSIMQGDKTEPSVIAALESIYEHRECFDAVAIIRGGGATSDLSCFDSYLLAANCAQFPLPVITGIGHERDETVLDIVAHTRAKTPTAVAEFLIGQMESLSGHLLDIQHSLSKTATQRLHEEEMRINATLAHLSYKYKETMQRQSADITKLSVLLKNTVNSSLSEEKHFLEMKEQHLRLISPQNILKKGYTLTLRSGKIVKYAGDLDIGDGITTLFADGRIESIVQKKNK